MINALVIEDDANIRENIVQTLEMEGMTTFQAAEGGSGIQLARQNKPDIVICDILMPGVNGYDVLTTLRGDPTTARIPFIFLTALANRESQRQGMNLGADDYVIKPFRADELLSAIEARLEKHRLTNEEHEMQLSHIKNTVIQALPHELRTPLTGLLGCADLIAMDYNTIPRDSLKKIGDLMVTSANRLHHLIENYLMYAQIELTAVDDKKIDTMRHERDDMADISIMNTSINEAEVVSRADDLEIDVQPGTIAIGEHNLGKLLHEIVNNAFKFSEAETPVKVEGSATDDGYYVIRVTNQGRGMTTEQITQIGALVQFERAVYEQQGLGLGLMIAKRLTEIYGGDLLIESEPDAYLTVQIRLPTAQ